MNPHESDHGFNAWFSDNGDSEELKRDYEDYKRDAADTDDKPVTFKEYARLRWEAMQESAKPLKPLLQEGDRIKLSDQQFKNPANVINAILGALATGAGDVSPWAVRYLLKHLDRVTLIKLYNDACSHDYADIKRGVDAENPRTEPVEGDNSVVEMLAT